MDAATVAAEIDRACDVDMLHLVADALVKAEDTPERRQIAWAFRYMEDHPDGRFGPWLELTDGTQDPPDLAEQPTAVLDRWEQVAAHVTHPRARARLHDVLFSARHGSVGTHRALAQAAYVEVGALADPPTLESADSLTRAFALARAGKDVSGEEAIIDDMLEAFRTSMAVTPEYPGIYLRFADPLVAAGAGGTILDDLLAQARDVVDFFVAENVIDLQRRRCGDSASRQALDRELVEVILAHADTREPMVAVMLREKAAGLARARGLPDLFDQVVTLMQAAGPVELSRIRTEIPGLTVEQFNEIVESLIGFSWWETVVIILHNGPPSGQVAANRAAAEQAAREAPLQAHLPGVLLGSDGLPRHTPRDDEELADDQLVKVERLALQVQGGMFAEALARATIRFGPSLWDITGPLLDAGCAASTAHAIYRVVCRYRLGDHEGALYSALPLCERLIRDLLISAGHSVYRVQTASARAGYAGFGAMLPDLAALGIDDSWHRFISVFLVAENGINLRNEALHGFIDYPDDTAAALVIITLLYLASLQVSRVPTADHEAADPSAAYEADNE